MASMARPCFQNFSKYPCSLTKMSGSFISIAITGTAFRFCVSFGGRAYDMTRLQKIIDLAKASMEVTVEVEVFIPAEKCSGIKDFSMYSLQKHQLAAVSSPTHRPHGIPLEWLLAS